MSALGDEKAAAKKSFKITGRFTGGVVSSGKWRPESKGAFGNDWEAEARYQANEAPQSTMTQRLNAVSKNNSLKRSERLDFPDSVTMPDKELSFRDRIEKRVKGAIYKKKETILSKDKSTETKDNLFSTTRAGKETTRITDLLKGLN